MGAGVGTVHGFVSSKDDGVDESHWGSKPRGLLLTTCRFHTAAIVDLVTCQDHSFFVSADAAGTCAVWLSGNLNKEVVIKPVAVYAGHGAPITSLTMIDNTTSVASAATNGTVHVWKVDLSVASQAPQRPPAPPSSHSPHPRTAPGPAPPSDGISTVVTLTVKGEGAVTSVRHFNDAVHSRLLFVTQAPALHMFDLRDRKPMWRLPVPVELGYVTSMELCQGNHAVVIGTSRGVVAVIDLRFQLLVCAWRHSSRAPVTALFPYITKSRGAAAPGPEGGKGTSAGSVSGSSGPTTKYLACGVACGEGDVSFWNLETGQAIRVLRVLPVEVAELAALRAPFLTRIPTKGNAVANPLPASVPGSGEGSALFAIKVALEELRSLPPPHNVVHRILCPLPTSNESSIGFVLGGLRGAGSQARGRVASDTDELVDTNGLPCWLLTASSDSVVRCWDFDRPHVSHTVMGLLAGESRHVYMGHVCHKYPSAPDSSAGGAGAGGVGGGGVGTTGPGGVTTLSAVASAAEAVAAGVLGRHFPTHTSPDGISMAWAWEHVKHPPPAMIVCQQPTSPLDNPLVMPGSFAHTSSPSLQLKGLTPAVTRHDNDVVAMTWLDIPTRLLVTGGKDGLVKVWR